MSDEQRPERSMAFKPRPQPQPFWREPPRLPPPLWILLLSPTLALVMGLAYTFGNPVRTLGPSFDAAKTVAPMRVWGLLFLVGVLVLILSLLSQSHAFMAGAWFFGGILYSWWAACFALQALTDPAASLVGWAPYSILALLHFVVAARLWSGRSHR